jgi:hypothetical protein
MRSSDQEDAVTRASFAGPRPDFETEGFSSRFVTGFSKSGGGKCMIYMYYKSQKPKAWRNSHKVQGIVFYKIGMRGEIMPRK